MYENERAKSSALALDGPYPDLGREVRRLLGWEVGSDHPYLSTRAAQTKTGVNFTTIALIARGFRARADTLKKIASGLGGDEDLLLVLADHIPPGMRDRLLTTPTPTDAELLLRIGQPLSMKGMGSIPLSLSSASAGEALPSDQQNFLESLRDLLPNEAHAIKVEGDCMEPMYHHGDILVIRPGPQAENGDNVIAHLDDDTLTCKQYRISGDGVPHLEAINGKWPEIPANRFRIIGVIEYFMRRPKRHEAN